MLKQYSKYDIATFIALVLHICGFIGILFIDKELFAAATTVNLLIMFVLLFWTQAQKNSWFFLFFTITYLVGFGVEWVGVNTSWLFGDYHYRAVMGYQFKKVPLIIGINWFIIIYCSGITIHTILHRAILKIAEQTGAPMMRLKPVSVIVDGATLAVFFDWIMEPAAIKLGYWHWNTADGSIPLLNYACWFVVSLVLVGLFYILKFSKHNKFAVHLLLIQLMFFLLLRTFFMNWLTFIPIVIGTFFIMEGITWLTHRYVMHGFLWYLHEDHHKPVGHTLEKNDAFFLIFAIPSWLCIMLGLQNKLYWVAAIGFGIALYGLAYFIVHEVIIHQRFKLFTKSNNSYIKTIRWAHKMHHKHLDKHEGESFGMLFVAKKYWEKVKKDRLLQAK